MNKMQHEQLFTDLTPEQAAVVEGGLYRLDSIEGVRVSADPIGGDEPYINVNGTKIWSGSLEQGGTATINQLAPEAASISLYDNDPWPNPDDPIGAPQSLSPNQSVLAFDGGPDSSRYLLRYTNV